MAAPLPGPVQQRRPPWPPAGSRTRPAGPHPRIPRAAPGGPAARYHQAVVVHRQRHHTQARGPGGLPEPRRARVLHADRGVPVVAQRVRDLGDGLPGAGEDRQGAGLGSRAPAPVQVRGQDLAQPWVAAVLGVVELVERRGLGGDPDRLDPPAPREGALVGPVGQVVANRTGRLLGGSGGPWWVLVRPGRPAHPGGRTGPAGQVPLGDQAAVGLGHRPAGHAQVGRERPAGRQRGAVRQPPVPDGRPDRAGQPGGQPARAVAPGPGTASSVCQARLVCFPATRLDRSRCPATSTVVKSPPESGRSGHVFVGAQQGRPVVAAAAAGPGSAGRVLHRPGRGRGRLQPDEAGGPAAGEPGPRVSWSGWPGAGPAGAPARPGGRTE